MNVLVIEDDTNIAFAIERFLTNQGHKVIHSKSLEEAYAFYPERQDFVLLDLNLPDGDGFEYLSYIRSEGIKTPGYTPYCFGPRKGYCPWSGNRCR